MSTLLATEYEKLIAELDKLLDKTRTFWLEAKTPEEKQRWKLAIDDSLDERLRLMKLRDATA